MEGSEEDGEAEDGDEEEEVVQGVAAMWSPTMEQRCDCLCSVVSLPFLQLSLPLRVARWPLCAA